MFKRYGFKLWLVLLLIAGFGSLAQAQGGALAYDDFITDTLNPGSPIIYTFTGTAGDVVSVYVIGNSALDVTVALSDSSGQSFGFSDEDPLTPMSNDARVTATLPTSGTYIVTLNNRSANSGTFTLSLTASMGAEASTLSERITVTIAPDGDAQYFTIPNNPDIPQVLSVQSLSDGEFTIQVQSAEGAVLASVGGGLDGATFVLPASDSPYTVIINASDSAQGTEVELAILAGAASPSTSSESGSNNDSSQPVVTDPNQCTITADNANVRSGPGTNYEIIGAITGSSQYIATGQNSGWYNFSYNGQSAWVAASVVNASGNCNLPLVDAPSAPSAPAPDTTEEPVQQATPTSTPTTTGGQQQPTTTSPTEVTPTQVPTEAPTETPFVVESISCRYFLNDGATVDFRVNGAPSTTFTIEVRQGSNVYSAQRTMNPQGFLSGNQRFGQAGNPNYTAYIVYQGIDRANAPC